MIVLWAAVAFAQPAWTELAEVGAADAKTTLRYASWDAYSSAVFQQCAETFVETNPTVRVRLQFASPDRYFALLDEELAAGGGPDVFVVDLEHVPDLSARGYLVDLAPFASADKSLASIFTGRLENLWVRAGHRWAWPKDWRPVALAYDRQALRKAGVTERELVGARWNPTDGGSFERIVKRLTGPDRHGLAMHAADGGAPFGYHEWSYLAYGHGFRFTEYLYARGVNYGDPRLVGALAWMARGISEGWVAPLGVPGDTLFLEGRAALVAVSSASVDRLSAGDHDVGFAPLPMGAADRIDIIRGTGDAINANSQVKESAWLWTRHMGSVDCQVRMGDAGIAFPGLDAGIEHALDAQKLRGNDLSAFVHQGSRSGQVLAPVIDQTGAVRDLATPVIQGILGGSITDIEGALEKLQEDIDDVFWQELMQGQPPEK